MGTLGRRKVRCAREEQAVNQSQKGLIDRFVAKWHHSDLAKVAAMGGVPIVGEASAVFRLHNEGNDPTDLQSHPSDSK